MWWYIMIHHLHISSDWSKLWSWWKSQMAIKKHQQNQKKIVSHHSDDILIVYRNRLVNQKSISATVSTDILFWWTRFLWYASCISPECCAFAYPPSSWWLMLHYVFFNNIKVGGILFISKWKTIINDQL